MQFEQQASNTTDVSPGIGRSETETHINVNYENRFTMFENGQMRPCVQRKQVKTCKRVPKLGVMLVGLGGNNGSTFTAGIIANRHKMSWATKNGTAHANFFGSFTQSATTHAGFKMNETTGALEDVFMPIKELPPMVSPIDMDVAGWDINGANLHEALIRAQVLEPTLIQQLKEEMEQIKPLPAALNPDFIAANQADRSNNVLLGNNQQLIDSIRADIRESKARNDKVIVLWTANTEMMMLPEIPTMEALEAMIKDNVALPSSVLYCVASILEGVTYLNGSPQNTFHPAVVALAAKHGSCIAGADFKSGQTRFKTVMSDFLIGSGIRIASVVSYNHLGNNDGKNLQEDKCFQSKKISKAGVLDDAIKSNQILYPQDPTVPQSEKSSRDVGDKIDHEVVIKYNPFVGDSKRALDEYSSQIFLGGTNTISTYNVCEDSLLAVPLMYDMLILGELFTRVEVDNEPMGPVLSYLSFFFKAPITNHDQYIINSFNRQKEALVSLLKVCAGLMPDDGTLLAFKF